MLVSLCTHLVRLDKEEYDVEMKILADHVRLERFCQKKEANYLNFFKTSNFTNRDDAAAADERHKIDQYNEY